ncbi:growth arrest and DNA damage-inducible protein GADD45 alpha-like [Mizuhopecten yessoensis]|uniref:Growth arrest and DNA damage-inducible protein GADD45 alpha n=1 Tax=Mizuhopecten yessoensis TaxID=6573 RepID=A0A210QJD9_MIZYE|nr:growth arrest and DNA damage-inducible protein GADD45 alpha-like [Mizuhopecten yessoensis]OWF48862.1 Growth arrest and DNA damage-inducible protein GADD45 alpha [Mizuhopecten yessoensis]
MTLPEGTEASAAICNKKPMNFGNIVKDFLMRASEEERITFGVYGCAKLMEANPDSVGLCVLAKAVPADVSVDIQNTLMEAHCVEHNVRVLKVDSSEKLEKILSLHYKNNKEGSPPHRPPAEYTCILVQHAKKEVPADEMLLACCDEMMTDGVLFHHPLQLPI